MSDSSYVFVDPDGRVRVPSPPQEWQYVSQSEYDPQHPAVVVVSRRDDTEPALLNEPQSGSVKAEGQSLLYTFEDEEVATNTTSSNSVTMTEVALPEYTFSAGQRDRVRQQQAEDAKRIADMIQLQEEERRRASEEHDRAVALEIIRREEEAATLQRANEAQRESERLAHQLAVELRERERAEEEAHRLADQRLAEEEHRQRLKEEVARQQAVTQERAKALEAASRLEAEHMRLETERRYREHLRMEEERAKAAEEEDRRMAEQMRANSIERFDEDRLRQLAEDEAVARAMAESETTEVAPPPVAVSVGCRCLGASRGFHRVDCPLK